jgi:HlyD family secretion protein
MSVLAIPTPSLPVRKFPVIPVVIGAMILGGLSYLSYVYLRSGPAANAFVGNYQPATRMDLDVRLTKEGELQAVNNIDVTNKVEGINTIQELVKEGTFVHKGDVLATLDSSNIQKNFDQSMLDLRSAEAALSAAKEAKEIQEATNTANLQEAELALEVAKLDLQEYIDGVSPQLEAEARTKLKMAEIMVKNKDEDLVITKNLFNKGFVTAVDVKKGELEVLTVQNDRQKCETDLKVLLDYTRAKNLATKKSAVAQAEGKVSRVRKENSANLNKVQADLEAKEQTLTLRTQLTAKLKESLENCTIKAPADGMVIYASSSSRGSDDQIKEGGTVRLQQVICRLPDVSSMKAVIRAAEGWVPRLRVDDSDPMRATVNITGIKKPIGASLAKISVLADSSMRWLNPDLKEYPVELSLDETPGLCKPGMSCAVEILIDRKNKVVAVPLTSIYSQGPQSFVFLRNGAGEPKAVEIKIGATNDTHAEVISGVQEGDDVLLLQPGQGRNLLERAGVKLAPLTRPGDQPVKRRGGKRADMDKSPKPKITALPNN